MEYSCSADWNLQLEATLCFVYEASIRNNPGRCLRFMFRPGRVEHMSEFDRKVHGREGPIGELEVEFLFVVL